MKRHGRTTIVIAGILLVLALTAAALAASMPRQDYVLRVDGSPVGEAEFSLLLHENALQYENEICQELGAANRQDVLSRLEGGEEAYRRLLAEKNIACIARLRVEQQLAADCGLMEEFSWSRFLERLEEENRSRADAISRGEPVYGLREFSARQYYSYLMSGLRLKLPDALPEERLAVSDQAVDAYYAQLPYFAHLEGERIHYTLYDVTRARSLTDAQRQALCSEIRETMADGRYETLAAGDMEFYPDRRTFGPAQLRNFIRQDMESEFLLSLAPGEVTEAFTLGGHTYIAQYNGFDKAERLADSEREAFRKYLKEQAYAALVTELADSAEIEINQAALQAYIEEGEQQT